jgi:hypothetical protein|nr:hypothetical protein [Aeromicrobium sp.]
MVDDFENYADLNGGATAATIREAADSPSTHAATLQTLVTDLADDSQQIRSTIEGDFQDATAINLNPATAAARRLTQSGLYAVGLLNSLADTVETFDTEVETLNTELHDNTYARWQAQNNTTSDNSEAGSGDDGDDAPELSYAEIKAEEKAKLQGRYDRAHTALETEADRVAGLFEGTPDLDDVKQLVLLGYIPLTMAGVWPDLELTDDERQQAVREMTPQEQAEYVQNTEDLPPGLADVISPEAQQILANDVAGDIKDKDIDGDTVRIMDLLKDQEPFAHGLYSQVSTEELAQAIKSVNDDAFPGGQVVNLNDPDKVEFYKDFLSAAGATFATYTKGTGDYAPPSDLTDRWFDAITTDDKGEGAALTMLIRAGGQSSSFEPDFLSDLTGRVYDWERDQDGAVWGPRNNNDVVNPFLTDLGDGTYDGKYVYGGDGLANLLGAMEHTPEAAHDFFDAGYPDGDTSEENSRLKYLLEDRTFSDERGSDNGNGLGAALESASVGSREDDPEWSARFTSEMFNTIAEKSGSGDGTFIGMDYPDDAWHIWPGMADNLGNIGASYSSDIYDIVAGSPAPGDTHLQIDSGDLDKVFGEIGRGNKDGIETLSAGIMLEGNERLQDAIDEWKAEHPGEAIDLESVTEGSLGEALRGRGGTNGEILGHIINTAITVDEHDQTLAETRAAYVSKALDITGGFIPGAGTVLGEGANELLKSGYDVAKSEGLDALKNAVASAPDATSGEYVRSERSSMSDALENNITSQLIRSGILTVGDGPHQIPESLTTAGPPETGPNGEQIETRVLNPDLYDSDGPDTIGEDDDYTDAERRQMLEDLYDWANGNSSSYVESITQPAQDGLDRELNKR